MIDIYIAYRTFRLYDINECEIDEYEEVTIIGADSIPSAFEQVVQSFEEIKDSIIANYDEPISIMMGSTIKIKKTKPIK
jgi:hypothetical protein